MTTGFIIAIIIIALLLVFSAFFSGAETALTAASPARLHTAEKEGDTRAALVNRILSRKESMIGGLLLGSNVVNITASSIATGALISLFGDSGVVYASAIMTVLVVIFSEVMPKTYAIHHAEGVSKFVAPLVYALMFIFAPATAVITKIVRVSLSLFGVDISKVHEGAHLEMLRGMIDMHTGPDAEVQKQRAMLRSILDLADVTVEEVLIHRKNVTMFDLEDPIDDVMDRMMKCPYSRLPVYRGTPDNIVGVVHTKWLMRELKAARGDVSRINLEQIAGDPWFIPDTTTLYDQLQAFRDRGEHFAFIVDEYGSFKGVVTLEDILEEIVGEIADEHDMHISGVRAQPNGSYMVNGDVTIRDLRRELDWELPDDEYSTVAGLLLYETRQIPKTGQVFTFHGFRFDVVRRQRNQITLVRITPPTAI